MKVYDAPGIRNVGVVGHGGCGKTSLVSALLFDVGAQTRLGRVDDGTAPTDFDPDEIERKIKAARVIALGVVEEWRGRGVDALLYYETARAGLAGVPICRPWRSGWPGR